MDLLHAIVFDKPLMLTEPDPGTTRMSCTDGGYPDAEVFARLTPLILAEQEEFARTSHSVHSKKLQGLPELFSRAAACTSDVLSDDGTDDFRTRDEVVVENFRCSLEHFWQENCQHDPTAGDAQSMATACHLDMSICYNLVLGIPHRHEHNQAYVDGLFIAMRNIKDSTWDRLPYLRLLM